MKYWLVSILAAALGYFAGSLDSSVVASNFVFHRNLRKLGTGNVWLSNFRRIFGWKGVALLSLTELLLDLVPVLLGGLIFRAAGPNLGQIGRGLAGFCLVMGKLWPFFNGLRGRSGIPALLVASFCLEPAVGVVVLIVVTAGVALSRYLCIGAVAGALLLVVTGVLVLDGLALRLALFIALAVTVRHIPSLLRLREGRELRLSLEKDVTYKLDERF